MKKWISLLMAVVLCLMLLPGCGSSGDTPQASSGDNGTGDEPYTVTMMFIGNPQDDEAKVEAAINELTMRDLNMKLDIYVVPWASAVEQIRLMLSGGEKLDLMLATNSSAATYVATKSVYDLSELIDQYGSNIKAAMGDAAKVANIKGYVYGVSNACNWYTQTAILLRQDWLEEAGFQKSDVQSIADLEKVYEAVYKNHPDAAMLAMKNGQSFDSSWSDSDSLGDGWGVLMNYGESPEVVNYFATDEYREFVERQYRWAQKGWISKDAATTTDTCDSMIGAGEAFSQISIVHPSMELEATLNTGTPMLICPLKEYEMYTTTTLSTPFFWCIARNSTEPEKAMQMLDYIYGSAEVANLLNWGIEGEHYVLTEDGHAAFPEGMDKSNDPYNAQFAFELPNQFITHVWEGQPLDVHQQNIANNAKARRSCAYGFAYDGTAFTNEIAALNNVKSQYLDALNTGAVNPAEVLPQFLQALEDAGIQKVISAKQEQLNAWLAEQN